MCEAMPIGRDEFLRELGAEFPEVIAEIDECRKGLLHCEVGVLMRASEVAMDAGRAWLAERHFRFVERMLRGANPELDNALGVSYLCDLALGEHTAQRYRIVKERMPIGLREQMIAASDFWK